MSRGRRKKNVTREEWVDGIIDGIAGSEGVKSSEVDLTDEIQQQIDLYTAAVDEAVEKCSRHFPPAQPIEVEEDDYRAIYHTLAGDGVGIWDGRWDHHYPGYTQVQWNDLARCYRGKLGRFVDETGGGSLIEAIRDAVWEAKPDEGDDEGDEDDEDRLGGGLQLQLEEVNAHRRRLHMPELDPVRSGWTPDDIRAEYTRIRALNPVTLRDELLRW